MKLWRSAVRCALLCLVLGFFVLQPAVAQSDDLMLNNQDGETSGMLAAIDEKTVTRGEKQVAVSLEQAIKIAKEAFVVPESFDQFSTGFHQSENVAYWDMQWSCSASTGGDMSVQVNAETGEICGMHIYLPAMTEQGYQGLPKYNWEQLESTAADLAKKLQPERFKKTRLQPERDNDYNHLSLIKRRGQVKYRYSYVRLVNGVPYPENSINITVSGDTGEITGYDLNWDDSRDFPDVAGCITQAQAEEIFRAKAGPERVYFRPQVPGGKEVPLKLVYRLPGSQEQVIIDALTGKLLNEEEDYYELYDMAGGEEYVNNSMRQKAVELTPVEESAVEDTKNLLSRDKALEMAKSAIKIPRGYTLNSSRMVQDYLFKEKKIWNFDWQGEDDSNQGWISAAVDAATGELLSFSKDRSYNRLETAEAKFSEEAARKIAEDYIKKLQPGKWQQLVFENARPEYWSETGMKEESSPRLYSFRWVRVEKEIKFPQNGFILDVDSATGEINRYDMTWWDVDFPEPQGVMSGEDAAGRYLQEAPLTLAYLLVWSHDQWGGQRDPKIHLVYRQDRRDFAMLDAITGQTLDYDGNIVTRADEKGKFGDLEGHPAREDVEMLAQSGIVTGENGNFRPDDAISQAELIAMLVKSGGQLPYIKKIRTGSGAGKDPWYISYYDAAARMGIIQAGEQPEPDVAVTREVLARLSINAMGLSKAARLGDIYVLNFQDSAEIAESLRGYAALASRIGLIEPVDGKFLPNAVVSRAEAATSLVKLLKSGN